MLSLLLSLAQANDAMVPALRVGDCGGAHAAAPDLPAGDLPPAIRLSMAQCLLDQHPHVAVGQLDGLLAAPWPGAYEPYARGLQIQALVALDEPIQALALSTDALPDKVRDQTLFARAQGLLALQQYEKAAETLETLLHPRQAAGASVVDGLVVGELRWYLSQAYGSLGETTKAQKTLATLWSHNPSYVLEAPQNPAPSLVEQRIASLEKQHRYPEALALRDQLGQQDPKTLAHASFKARDYERSLDHFALIRSPSAYDRFQYALATSRTGDYRLAAVRYQSLVDAAPTHKRADYASFKLGYLAYDEGRFEDAVLAFDQHLTRLPSSKHAAEARWFWAWSLFRSGQKADALVALHDLEKHHANDPLVWSARYWSARLQDQNTGHIAKQAPLSAYAWFAEQTQPRRPSRGPSPTPLADTPSHTLAQAGLGDWVRDDLEKQATGYDPVLGRALMEAGGYTSAQKMGRKQCRGPTSSNEVACGLRYPRPAQLVVEQTIEADMPRHLPYAIMTAESALKPWVTSPAGARGLMQLMPRVAETHHQAVVPGRPFDPQLLYKPDYNAAVGTQELVRLWNHFAILDPTTRVVATIAGYNAGVEAVERWLKDQPSVEADVFAENIGYTETRNYVKRVLATMQIYRLVYGD